jgi:hypothetical protein
MQIVDVPIGNYVLTGFFDQRFVVVWDGFGVMAIWTTTASAEHVDGHEVATLGAKGGKRASVVEIRPAAPNSEQAAVISTTARCNCTAPHLPPPTQCPAIKKRLPMTTRKVHEQYVRPRAFRGRRTKHSELRAAKCRAAGNA